MIPNDMHHKRVILHRADAPVLKQAQSVIVLPHASTTPTASHSQPGDTVGHALRLGMMPSDYTIVNPKTKALMDADEDLYDLVSNGDTVEVVEIPKLVDA